MIFSSILSQIVRIRAVSKSNNITFNFKNTHQKLEATHNSDWSIRIDH